MGLKPDKCLCAFCRLERRVYRKKHISMINVLLSFFVSALSMAVFWENADARALLFFVIFLSIAEIFIQVRWRLTLSCPFCGFDPVLYLRSPAQATAKVKKKLEESRNSPTLLSAHNPWTHLQKLSVRPRSHSATENSFSSKVEV
jgi:hypothetical protein